MCSLNHNTGSTKITLNLCFQIKFQLDQLVKLADRVIAFLMSRHRHICQNWFKIFFFRVGVKEKYRKMDQY